MYRGKRLSHAGKGKKKKKNDNLKGRWGWEKTGKESGSHKVQFME